MKILSGLHAVTGILLLLMAYNVVCVFVFAGVYTMVDFQKHFAIPDEVENNWSTRMYYSLAVQATCMAGEIYPKTTLAHTIQSLQIVSSWLVTLMLVVPWIRGVR